MQSHVQLGLEDLLQEGAPGVSIAVVVDGVTYFGNAGTTGKGGRVTKDSIFETASLSKVLTTTLLGLDVAREKKHLKDRIEDYLPKGDRPRRRMRVATLQMLANFRAGLPDTPPDYERLDPGERGVNQYTVKHLLRFLSRFKPSIRLPANRVYSDTSVGLLGLCLGGARLGSWERRLKNEICKPLGMADTTVTLSRGQVGRLVIGLKSDGTTAERWPTHAIAAADGVKSSTADLAKFLVALLEQDPNVSDDLARGMRIATDTRYPFEGGVYLQALSWTWQKIKVGDEDQWVIEKTGGVPGFATQLTFSRDLGIGVAILASRQGIAVRRVSQDLIREIAADRAQ